MSESAPSPYVPPKVFISYSWTGDAHKDWVFHLAKKLGKPGGIDASLDRYDLSHGHDAFYFMEQALNDPEIRKVLCICDQEYVRKANERVGGAGAEAGMIAVQVHGNPRQNKFIPIILVKDENGKPVLPNFLQGRYGIDFSDQDDFDERFRELVCAIHEVSYCEKPEIGPRPDELLRGNTPEEPRAGTTTKGQARKVREALENEKLNKAKGDLNEYLRAVGGVISATLISKDMKGEIDELVLKQIDEFSPYRQEFLELFRRVCEYTEGPALVFPFRDCLEKTLDLLYGDDGYSGYGSELRFDALLFVIRDLFLHMCAILLDTNRHHDLPILLDHGYHYTRHGRGHTESYSVFDEYLRSLDEYRNNRLKLNRISVNADEIHERSSVAGITFAQLMQMDLILAVRWIVHQDGWGWYPRSLVYASHARASFPVFSAANNPTRFKMLSELLGVRSKAELLQKLGQGDKMATMKKWGGNWSRVNALDLMNVDEWPS